MANREADQVSPEATYLWRHDGIKEKEPPREIFIDSSRIGLYQHLIHGFAGKVDMAFYYFDKPVPLEQHAKDFEQERFICMSEEEIEAITATGLVIDDLRDESVTLLTQFLSLPDETPVRIQSVPDLQSRSPGEDNERDEHTMSDLAGRIEKYFTQPEIELQIKENPRRYAVDITRSPLLTRGGISQIPTRIVAPLGVIRDVMVSTAAEARSIEITYGNPIQSFADLLKMNEEVTSTPRAERQSRSKGQMY